MKKPPHRAEGQISIIGGKWRGRKLPVPHSIGLRPTTDRVRETLFNWLAPVIENARCLDCFAGSGALGFEALSRHAGHVTLLELEPAVARLLESNRLKLNAIEAHIINADTLNWLRQYGEPYDVIFIDPPFRKGLLEQTLPLLEEYGWLTAEATIYIESAAESDAPVVPANWHLCRQKKAGQIAYRLYQRQPVKEE